MRLPATIDSVDKINIGKMILFSSLRDVHGLINVGLHIVLIEKRIE